MLVSYIRSSSYNNYDYCQQQYYISYVLGHSTVSGKKAQMGTIVHKVMECLARAKKSLQDNKKSFKDDVLGRVRITKDKVKSEKFVNTLIEKSYEHYTNDSPHDFTKKDFRDCEKWSWMAIHYNNGQFDPRNRNVVEAEPHFDIEITEPWAKYSYDLPDGTKLEGNLAIKGTIDLVTQIDDGVIEVIDWKTGRRIDWASGEEKTYEKLSIDPQLLLYYYAISKIFPDYKQAIMSIFYIRDGGPFSLCFDESDQTMFLDMLRTRFAQIKNNTKPQLISKNRSHWKCTRLCDYCKNDWEGTDKSICQYVQEEVEKNGIEQATLTCTQKGFSLGYYDAPG